MCLEKPRLQALLAYLILNHRGPVPRRSIAFAFWPDSTEAQALTNLRHLLHRLHQAWPEGKKYLVADQTTIWWHTQAPWFCDAASFAELVLLSGDVADEQQERLLLTQAVDFYHGDLLPGMDDEWIVRSRDNLQESYRAALERLAVLCESAGDLSAAIRCGERLVRIDPLNEAIYRWLMVLHCRNGDRSAALHVYHQCSRILQIELGIQPDASTQAIYEQVLREPGSHLIPLVASGEFAPPLIGRTTQWQVLLDCWRGIITGSSQSQCVLVSGEPGVGKTSLAQAFAGWVQQQGGTVAITSCYGNEGVMPFTPLVDWLRSYSLAGLPPVLSSELTRLSPLLINRPHPEALDHERGQRLRLFQALTEATLLQKQPILLVLDNAHLADQDSLEWLLFLLRHNPRARLMILLTLQAGSISGDESPWSLFDELQLNSRLSEVTLERLDRSATGSLVTRLAGRPLAESMIDVLFKFSNGNPFLIVEAIQANGLAFNYTEEKTLEKLENSLYELTPPIRAFLSTRLTGLKPEAVQILEIAAVIGRSFRTDTVLHASSFDEDTLLLNLDELWRKRLIVERDYQKYDFQHELLRRFIYDRMSYSRRRLLHGRAAAALRKVFEGNLDPICAELAHHYGVTGQILEAARFYTQAFKVAQRLYSSRNAIQFSEKAVAYFRQMAAAAQNEDDRQKMIRAQIEIICNRDWNYRLLGNVSALQKDLDSLVVLNQQLGDAALSAKITRRQAVLDYRFCRFSEALFHAQQGIKVSQAIGDRQTEAYCRQILGRALGARGEYGEGLRVLREASTMFQELHNPIESIHCLSYLSTLYLKMQQGPAALRVAKEALALCEQHDLSAQRRFALGDSGAAALSLGELENAASWLSQSLTLAHEFDDRTQEVFCLGHLGWLRLERKEYSLGLESFQEAYELATQNKLHHYQSWLLSGLCAAYTKTGKVTEAKNYGERALRLADEYGMSFELSLAAEMLDQLQREPY